MLENVLRATAGADGPDSAHHVPISITDLEIDPPVGLIRAEKDRRAATGTFPSHHTVLALAAHLTRGASVVHRRRRLL